MPFRAYYVQSINACNLLSCCHESHSHAVPVYLRERDVLWYNEFFDSYRIAHQLIHFDLVEDQVWNNPFLLFLPMRMIIINTYKFQWFLYWLQSWTIQSLSCEKRCFTLDTVANDIAILDKKFQVFTIEGTVIIIKWEMTIQQFCVWKATDVNFSIIFMRQTDHTLLHNALLWWMVRNRLSAGFCSYA